MKSKFFCSVNPQKVAATVFLLSSMLIFSIQAIALGVYCKDCGNEDNCWQGNGLSSGYQDCQVFYDENGNPTGCQVFGWGNCEPIPE